MKPLSLFEFGKPEEVKLSNKNIRDISRINERFAKKGNNIINVNPTIKDTHLLRANNYVGVIQSSGMRIQILPKIYKKCVSKDDARNQSLKNLNYMLSFTRKLKTPETSQSVFHPYHDDFLEVYINIFLNELEEILRVIIFRQYIELNDNLSFVRGKIVISQHIKENIIKNNPGKIYCEYDELTEDNLINQTIKYTLRLLKVISRSNSNIDKINQLLFTLAEISDRKIKPEDEERIYFNKINESFRPIIVKCFLFINDFSIDLKAGSTNYGAILFDMNEVFEEFIANFIIKNKEMLGMKEYNIEPQKKLESLDDSNRIHLKPDLVFLNDNKSVIILDTKYKILDTTKKNYNISNSDIYQMLAYGLRGNCSKIVMLYPRPENYGEDEIKVIKIPLLYSNDCSDDIPEKVEIFARTIDIMRDNLKEAHDEIIQEMCNIFRECGINCMV